MNTQWKELIAEIAESYDWSAKFEDNPTDLYALYCIFTKYSPAGQECNIELYMAEANYDEVRDRLYARYEDFDVSEETYIWLDQFGHGANGAPYDMKDAYEDMQWFKDEMKVLYEAIKNKKTAKESSEDNAREEEKYDVVFKVVYGADGVTKDDFVKMFQLLTDTEGYPIEIMAKHRECSAICLVAPAGFEKMDFDYKESGFNDYIATVLDDKEYEDCSMFELKGIQILCI